MIGKNQEAGLAAGMESENKAQQNTDATKAAQKTSKYYDHKNKYNHERNS